MRKEARVPVLDGKTFSRTFEIAHNGHRVHFEEEYPGKFKIHVSDLHGNGINKKTVSLTRTKLDNVLSKANEEGEQTFPITVPDPVPGATRESKRNRTETVQIPCDKLRKELKRLDSLPPRVKG